MTLNEFTAIFDGAMMVRVNEETKRFAVWYGGTIVSIFVIDRPGAVDCFTLDKGSNGADAVETEMIKELEIE